MALAETAELAVKLSLGGNFLRQMGQVNKSLGTLDRNSSRAFRAGQQIGTGIKRGAAIAAGAVGLLASQVALGLDSLVKLEKATAQTEAVIKSTGGAAGVTAEQIRILAEKYEGLNATVGDEVIQSGQNLLLTFTAVRKEAFEPALQAALDLSTAMGTDLDSAIKTVGKALSEPAKAMARLRRQGIILTKEEEKQIQTHLDNNDALGAQNLILKALDKRYGGSFLAGGTTTAGKVAKFTDSIEDLQRSLANAALPAVGNIADALTELLADPEIQKGIADLGREIGKLFSKGNIKAGAKALGDAFQAIKSAAPAIKSALGTVGTVLKAAFDAFTSLPAPIQQLLIGGAVANKLTGGLVTNIAGGIFGALKAMTVQAGVVNVMGGIGGGGGGAPIAGGGAAAGAAAILPLAGIGALMVGAAGIVAEPLRKLLGVTDTGLGTVKAEVAGVKIAVGVSQAAQAHANDAIKGQNSKTQEKITTLGVTFGRVGKDTMSATERVKAAALETKRETTRGSQIVAATNRTGSASVVGAIYANRPVITTNVTVNATTVSKTVVVKERYGSSGGSRNQNSSGSGTIGNGGR